MVSHGALTIFTKIKPGKVEQLRSKLYEINTPPNDIEINSIIPFKKITSIHFSRFVILDEAKDLEGNIISPSLVFSTDYDNTLDLHLQELIAVAGNGLSDIFSFCEGFEKGQDLIRYMKRHRLACGASYRGAPFRSVARILREAELKNSLDQFIDNEIRTKKNIQDYISLRKSIFNYVHGEKKYSWIKEKEDPTLLWKAQFYFCLILFGSILLNVAIIAAIFTLIPIRLRERADNFEKKSLEEDKISQLVKDEDKIVQNQLTHLVDIKPGWFRLFVLKFVLFYINFLAKYIYIRGKLGYIPSIHFARWVIIDKGKRLLFFSNFDGSWENYLGDFVDKASGGLTGVWSNTVNFPLSKFLFFKGATDEQKFKMWTRANQIPTQVWYSAYKLLSVENINNNSRIRRGLASPMSKKKVKRWLKRF